MKLLIDTNVFIPLEPTSPSDREVLTDTTAKLHKLSIEAGFQIFLHPAAKIDIDKDFDEARKSLRYILFEKYLTLPDPPSITSELESFLGPAPVGTNDWVDHQLIQALHEDAVDFLITEDRRLRNKARRLGLLSRVVSVTEAISLIEDLVERIPRPPPAVRPVKAHAIDPKDSIFESFRIDYPEFEEWFRKCRREHRQSWVIDGKAKQIAALCIINEEKHPPRPLSGKVLKLCSFKVSDNFNGFRFGELLLKAVFEHASKNQYEWIFVTVFEKYGKLIELLEDFGFSLLDKKTDLEELIFAKPLNPNIEETYLEPLPYHIRFGPSHFRKDVPSYIIPIQPKYANILFPEASSQVGLFQGAYPSGNSIRKAYLCHAKTKSIPDGSIILFYRSHFDRGLIALGIVEETFRSSSSDEIARAVGKRTVYSLDEINLLCQRMVLVVLFRQAKIFSPPIPTEQLIEGGLFKRPPQSIASVKEEALSWIQKEVMR
jgi:L-amino acid N-acyltransferase YncA